MFWYPRAIQITEWSSWHLKLTCGLNLGLVCGCLQYCLSGDVKGYWVRFFACCKNLPLASDHRILKYLLLIEENNFFVGLPVAIPEPGSSWALYLLLCLWCSQWVLGIEVMCGLPEKLPLPPPPYPHLESSYFRTFYLVSVTVIWKFTRNNTSDPFCF